MRHETVAKQRPDVKTDIANLLLHSVGAGQSPISFGHLYCTDRCYIVPVNSHT